MGLIDAYIAYKFIRILSTPWKETKAYKLGIIDDKGKILIRRRDLKTTDQKLAYTVIHQIIWKIKRILEKVPIVNTRLGTIAAGLWFLKETTQCKDFEQVQKLFLEHATALGYEVLPEQLLESIDRYPRICKDSDGRLVTVKYVGRSIGIPIYLQESVERSGKNHNKKFITHEQARQLQRIS